MLDKNDIANEGGINRTGIGLVNTNSKDYKGLQAAIVAHAKQQTPEERIRYHLIGLKYQMQSYLTQKVPQNIKTAGNFLKEHIKAIGIKHKLFAQYIDLEESNLSAILKGKRKINTTVAYKLGLIFNVNPNLWLTIQSKNELLEINKKETSNPKIYQLEDLLKKAS